MLLGGRVEHSISPAMQQAAFRARGLEWTYEARAVGEEGLERAVAELRQSPWAGANVTFPHKVRVIGLLDNLDAHATRIGAVNTIVAADGHLQGFNTDAEALIRDMTALGVELRGKAAVILGSGGAARAAAWGLGASGAYITLIVRTPSRGRAWLPGLERHVGRSIEILPWVDDSFARQPAGARVVNATPVGMWPKGEECPWPAHIPLPGQGVIYDMIYRPRPSKLVSRGRAHGLDAWDGLGMLVEQGALAFEHWTELEAPRRVMRAAADRALEVGLDQLPNRR
jgi:shikimate dehydrogenase